MKKIKSSYIYFSLALSGFSLAGEITEGPDTVAAGSFLLETTVVDYSRNKSAGETSEGWSIGETRVEYGLNDSMDLQLVLPSYVREVTSGGGSREEVEGVGDVMLRLKWNLWGNDGGDTAFAILPYVKAPTGSSDISNDEWEGGVMLPWAIQLSDGVGLGLQAEVARVFDDGEYDTAFLHTAVLRFDVTDSLGTVIGLNSEAEDLNLFTSVTANF